MTSRDVIGTSARRRGAGRQRRADAQAARPRPLGRYGIHDVSTAGMRRARRRSLHPDRLPAKTRMAGNRAVCMSAVCRQVFGLADLKREWVRPARAADGRLVMNGGFALRLAHRFPDQGPVPMMGSFPLTAAGQRRIHTGFPLRFLAGARNTDGHKILWLLAMVNPICWSVATSGGDCVPRRDALTIARNQARWHGACWNGTAHQGEVMNGLGGLD